MMKWAFKNIVIGQTSHYANFKRTRLSLAILKFRIFDLVSYLANYRLKRRGNLWLCS